MSNVAGWGRWPRCTEATARFDVVSLRSRRAGGERHDSRSCVAGGRLVVGGSRDLGEQPQEGSEIRWIVVVHEAVAGVRIDLQVVVDANVSNGASTRRPRSWACRATRWRPRHGASPSTASCSAAFEQPQNGEALGLGGGPMTGGPASPPPHASSRRDSLTDVNPFSTAKRGRARRSSGSSGGSLGCDQRVRRPRWVAAERARARRRTSSGTAKEVASSLACRRVMGLPLRSRSS